MKLKTLASHLANHLDRSPSTFVELYRALREGLFAALADGVDGFSPPPVPADFLDRDMTALLIGRSGPQGGVAADPYVVALLVIASLVDSPRVDVARRAFDVFAATSDSGVCPLTGARYFGEALVAALTNRDLFFPADRIALVELSHDAGHAMISYDGDNPDDDQCRMSRFVVPNRPWPPKTSFFSGKLTFVGLRRLHEFIRGNPEFNTEAADEIKLRLNANKVTTT
ncbi:hypothetical protein ACIPUD_27925 [Bradyrhizobium sp. CAR08]